MTDTEDEIDTGIDWAAKDTTTVAAIVSEGQAVLNQRTLAERAGQDIDRLIRQYATQTGRDLSDGAEWVQPTGAHDAYPKGAIVSHDGKTWVSLVAANTWQPGISGWREKVTDDDGNPGIPEWVQPTGAHDAYQTGDEVRFEDRHYRSVIDGNVWSPADYPAGWEDLGPVEDYEQ